MHARTTFRLSILDLFRIPWPWQTLGRHSLRVLALQATNKTPSAEQLRIPPDVFPGQCQRIQLEGLADQPRWWLTRGFRLLFRAQPRYWTRMIIEIRGSRPKNKNEGEILAHAPFSRASERCDVRILCPPVPERHGGRLFATWLTGALAAACQGSSGYRKPIFTPSHGWVIKSLGESFCIWLVETFPVFIFFFC